MKTASFQNTLVRIIFTFQCCFMGGPIHMLSVMEDAKCNQMDLAFLKVIAVGGTSMTEKQIEDFHGYLEQHHASVHLCTGYGMTELSSTVTTELNGIQKVGSVGIPLVKVNVKVNDLESGKELPYGEIGEILISSPSLMDGYMDRDNTIFEQSEGGKRWIHTGDLGCVDEDGFLYIKGRIKRIFPIIDLKSNQYFKLFPDFIERELLKHPYVENCAVAVIPSDKTMNEASAFVVLRKEEHNIIDELRVFLADTVDEYLMPKQWHIVDEIPMLPSGKADYKKLEEMSDRE